MVLDRILRRDHEERLGEGIRKSVHRNLPFVHRFEQRRLRLGRRAINFIGQQHVRENGAAFEFEFLFDRRVNRNAQHVGRQHVAGELDALKRAIDGASEGLAECGLANSRSAFDQQMSLRENRDQGQAENVVLPANHAAQSAFQVHRAAGSRYHRLGSH